MVKLLTHSTCRNRSWLLCADNVSRCCSGSWADICGIRRGTKVFFMILDIWLDVRLIFKRITSHQTLQTFIDTKVQTIHVGFDFNGSIIISQVFMLISLSAEMKTGVSFNQRK